MLCTHWANNYSTKGSGFRYLPAPGYQSWENSGLAVDEAALGFPFLHRLYLNCREMAFFPHLKLFVFLFVCLLIFGSFPQPLFGSMPSNTLMWITTYPSEWYLHVLTCSLGSCFMCFLNILTMSHCIMHSLSDDVYHGLICANCLQISNCLSYISSTL